MVEMNWPVSLVAEKVDTAEELGQQLDHNKSYSDISRTQVACVKFLYLLVLTPTTKAFAKLQCRSDQLPILSGGFKDNCISAVSYGSGKAQSEQHKPRCCEGAGQQHLTESVVTKRAL